MPKTTTRIAGHRIDRRRNTLGLRTPARRRWWHVWRRRNLSRLGRPTSPRREWANIVTSLTALAALLFTGLSLQQTRQQNAMTEQGQITDRYTAAINQLGSSAMDVRLGGIYALQRIMNDSPKDQPTIVGVLAAFIRDHPPGSKTFSFPPVDLPPDIDASLSVLEGRNLKYDDGEYVNLEGVNFTNDTLNPVAMEGGPVIAMPHMSFPMLELPESNFAGANLDGSSMSYIDVNGSNFSGAKFDHADLSSSNMQNTQEQGVRFDNAILVGTNLSDVYFLRGSFIGTDFAYATIERSNFGGMIYKGLAEFGPDLHGDDFTQADLKDSVLIDANLTGAILVDADFTGANLSFANLSKTEITNTRLIGANLYGTLYCKGITPIEPSLRYQCKAPPLGGS